MGANEGAKMVKLDVSKLRYMSREHFRVLTAIEIGMKNHEIVPVTLIDRIAGMGRQIGCGKESDVFEVVDDEGRLFALKLHRLGRTSFRAVKKLRDYTRSGSKPSNWLYLSRLAALKEYSYMKALHAHGFIVPIPVDANRHAVLMELVPGIPLNNVIGCPNPVQLYGQLQDVLFKLARVGLVHCDFNEFNIMMHEDGSSFTIIDFPQIVSTSHLNAGELFMRDCQSLHDYFCRKFNLVLPMHVDGLPSLDNTDEVSLDKELKSSGFNAEQHAEFNEEIMAAVMARTSMRNGHQSINQYVEEEEEEEQDSSSGIDSDSDEDAQEELLEDEAAEGEDSQADGEEAVCGEAEAALLAEFEAAMVEGEQERSEEAEEAAAAVASKQLTGDSAGSPPRSPELVAVDGRLNPQGAINRAIGADVNAARDRAQEVADEKAAKVWVKKSTKAQFIRARVKKNISGQGGSKHEGGRNRNKLKGREKKKSVSVKQDAFWG